MLKITTPKLLIILAVLVAVFAIVKLTGGNDRSKSFRTELVNVDEEQVTRIEITDPESEVQLTREGDQWSVATPNGPKKALETTVKSMISTLNSVEPSRIASRSSSKWKDYAVDSSGTRVKVFSGSKVIADIVLGRFGVEGQRSFYTYVRLTEDEDTYVANNFMKMGINTKQEDYRNGEIIRLRRDSLNTITFNYPDSALVLSKNGDQWYKGVAEADSAAMVNYLRGLSAVMSREFVEADDLGTPDLNVTFGFTDTDEIQLFAFRKPDGWVIQSSTNDDEVWMDPAQFEKIFAASSSF